MDAGLNHCHNSKIHDLHIAYGRVCLLKWGDAAVLSMTASQFGFVHFTTGARTPGALVSATISNLVEQFGHDTSSHSGMNAEQVHFIVTQGGFPTWSRRCLDAHSLSLFVVKGVPTDTSTGQIRNWLVVKIRNAFLSFVISLTTTCRYTQCIQQ